VVKRGRPLPVNERTEAFTWTSGVTRMACCGRMTVQCGRPVAEPIFEADFCPCSYGFRRQRSAHDAADAVAQALLHGFGQVIDADLAKYFDTIPHAKLMAVIAQRISDGAVLGKDIAFSPIVVYMNTMVCSSCPPPLFGAKRMPHGQGHRKVPPRREKTERPV
jgi:hypothetical protein